MSWDRSEEDEVKFAIGVSTDGKARTSWRDGAEQYNLRSRLVGAGREDGRFQERWTTSVKSAFLPAWN